MNYKQRGSEFYCEKSYQQIPHSLSRFKPNCEIHLTNL